MDNQSRSRFMEMPSSRQGIAAESIGALVAAFYLIAKIIWPIGTSDRYILTAGLFWIVAEVLSWYAIIRKGERSWVLWLLVVMGLVITVFFLLVLFLVMVGYH